jgi:multiple sugar transport system permease protein
MISLKKPIGNTDEKTDKKTFVLTLAKKSGKQLSAMAFALPFLLIFAMFFFYPFFNGIRISFLNRQGEFVWFQNYQRILSSAFDDVFTYHKDFLNGLGNTLLFVVISVPCLIVVPLIVALLLDIQPKGYKVFRAILFMPTVFSISSVVLMWKQILQVETGFINSFFKLLNWRQIDFLGSQPWAWISILIVTIWWTMGTNMVILGAGLKNIDKSIYEAAEMDGASYLRTVWSITLPMLVGQLVVVFVMTLLASFNIYGQPSLLTAGGPNRSTQVLLMVVLNHLYDRPWIASSMSLLLGLIMIAISLTQAMLIKLKGRK